MDDSNTPQPPLPPDIEAALTPEPARRRKRRPKVPVPPEPPEKEEISPKRRGLRIVKLSAYKNAVDHKILTDLRLFDLARGWKDDGATSCSVWLSWRTGQRLQTCRAKLHIAHALADLKLIDDAFRRGTICYSQVRALVRHATPETEKELLELALNTSGAKLEKILAWIRQRAAADEGVPSLDQLRMRFDTMDNGVVEMRVKLRPEQLPVVLNALRAVKELACGRKQAHTMSNAQALVGAMELVLEGEVLKSTSAPVPGKYEALINVDAEVLRRRMRDPLERCEVQGQRPISAATALRLTCDCVAIPFLTLPDGRALDIGARRRRVSRKLMARLLARDEHCRYPGCTNRLFLDAHHIQHWAHGGETKLDNLVLTCRTHHTYVHEGGFSVQMLDEGPVFLDPHGERVRHGPVPVDLGDEPLDRAMSGIEGLGFGFSLQPRDLLALPGLRARYNQAVREMAAQTSGTSLFKQALLDRAAG